MAIRPYYDFSSFSPTPPAVPLTNQPSVAPIPSTSQPLPAMQRLLMANSAGGDASQGTQQGFDPASFENPLPSPTPYGEPRVDVPTTGGTAPYYPTVQQQPSPSPSPTPSYVPPSYSYAGTPASTPAPSMGWNPSEGGILGQIAGHIPQLAPYFIGQSIFRAGSSIWDWLTGHGGTSQTPSQAPLDLSGAPPVTVYPDLSNAPMVPAGPPLAAAAARTRVGKPQSNADVGWPGGMGFGSFANRMAANFGFGSGLTITGGGAWQPVSGIPEYSGFAGPTGRSRAGPDLP